MLGKFPVIGEHAGSIWTSHDSESEGKHDSRLIISNLIDLHYTGGIPQQLDTNVHSVVTAKMSTVLWQQNEHMQCSDSSVADIVVQH